MCCIIKETACSKAFRIVHFLLQHFSSRDILFIKLWNGLYCDPGATAIYLQSLEAVILEGKLPTIPPEIMQQLVKQLEQMDKWKVWIE